MPSAFYALFHLFALAALGVMAQRTPKVLIFSRTVGFRHDSIPAAVDALKRIGPASNVSFDATEDAAQFTDDNLRAYDGLLFLMTTGAVLGDDGVGALQRYLDAGGNFIGVHSASDSLTNVTFFGREIGAYFDYHPALQNATVLVLDKNHPSTQMLPDRWPVHDEIYNFKSDPRDVGATVLLSVDESSYVDDGTRKFDQGTPHPLAWYQEKGAGVDSNAARVGRSWYTALGHDVATWQNETYLAHVMGGVTWALASATTRAFDSSASVGNADGAAATASNSSSPDPSHDASTSTTSAASSAQTDTGAAPRRAGLSTFTASLAVMLALFGL